MAGAASGCVVTLRGVSDADRALVLETCGNEGNGSQVHVVGFPDFGFMQEVTRSWETTFKNISTDKHRDLQKTVHFADNYSNM